VIGFLFTISMIASLFGIYGTKMEGHVDSWWFYYSGLAYFGYRIFDELDGKQARRTGNSSVLGFFMDHGCDSYSCFMLCLLGIKAFQLGNTLISFALQVAVMGAFLFIVLEEYYKGYFTLGPFNGVSDGSLLVYLLFITTGVVGNEFWVNQVSVMGEEFKLIELFMLT
jgi:ethanolaminephosphotransferase